MPIPFPLYSFSELSFSLSESELIIHFFFVVLFKERKRNLSQTPEVFIIITDNTYPEIF
uniref:Uncharacterized protein n=1 Tax=Rhizophora mucronata TaxID=61149 RepID=A0A2P2PKM5_RHIMU